MSIGRTRGAEGEDHQAGSPRAGTRLQSDTLYAVIGVVASSPDLDTVLARVVDLLSEATDCHACFVYLRHGERLRLRAASRVFAHLVGVVELGIDEGLTGWVARHREPAFIRERALADPRSKYVAEMHDEQFQSMCAVPVPARSGESMGVIVLHTQAPREFDEGVLTFLAHTAALVAGAIENAQLYEDARQRVETLTRLSALSQELAGVTSREELYGAVTAGVRNLLRCEACRLYLLDADAKRLDLAAADPESESAPWAGDGTSVLLDLLREQTGPADRDDGRGILASAIAAGDEDLGVLAAVSGLPWSDEDGELLRAVGHQFAVALKKADLIERLTAENVVRDLFGALQAGSTDVAEARARTAGSALDRDHVVVQVEPIAQPAQDRDRPRPWPELAEHVEVRLRSMAPGALCDAGRESLRALLPLRKRRGEDSLATLEHALHELGVAHRVLVGVSASRRSVQDGQRSLREASDATFIARALVAEGGALAYRNLGAYRYLVRLPSDDPPDDRHHRAVERLVDYDRRRTSQLVATLEQYLRDRRMITAARALYIHPNTLRQRLERIAEVSGLDLATEDLASLELAVKLVRLHAG
jgi:GAF domain-containing protein